MDGLMVVLLPQLLPVSIVYTLGMDDSLHVFQQLEFQLYDLTFGKLVGGFCTFDLVCRYILTHIPKLAIDYPV